MGEKLALVSKVRTLSKLEKSSGFKDKLATLTVQRKWVQSAACIAPSRVEAFVDILDALLI